MSNHPFVLQLIAVAFVAVWYDDGNVTAFPPNFLGRRHGIPSTPGRVSASLQWSTETLSLSSISTETDPDPEIASILDDDFEFIRHYTELAIQERGNAQGLQALRILSEKCQQRVPFNFDDDDDDNSHNNENHREGTVVSHFRQVLPRNVTEAFLDQVRAMESQGWLSTNPDSVDGLPSLHLNLVSHGRPLVVTGQASNDDDFERGLETLIMLVEDPIYNLLLPRVRKLLNSSSIQVSDIFLRRYGQDVCEISRRGISAHYDVESRVTSVIALDDVAADGRNGLYTSYLSSSSGSRKRRTSNHAALRRFFPLQRGDGVVHTWDVLHGVDVEPHLDRTSLIIWFTEDDESREEGTENAAISHWLRPDTRQGDVDTQENDVTDFVLASAISSMTESLSEMDPQQGQEKMKDFPCEKELYLRSAENGNTFALTRLGSLLEEQALDEHLLEKAVGVLARLRDDVSTLPAPLRMGPTTTTGGAETMTTLLAMRFWFEGAVQGNPLAQRSLADELMMCASETGDEDTRLLAAVLFALAAQQGDDGASEALSRVVDFDLASRNVQNQEGFKASPVVQTAQAALAAC
jgi:hypothetical protein